MPEITIRRETPADYKAVRVLIVEVFYETYETGEIEAELIENLRAQPESISLVAEREGQVVGYILFSAVQLQNHLDVSASVLAPMGVYKQYQRQGIGTQLIRKGLEACKKQGVQVIVVQGSLEYYPRFGFVPINTSKLISPFASEYDMVMGFEANSLEKLSGLVVYPQAWQSLLP